MCKVNTTVKFVIRLALRHNRGKVTRLATSLAGDKDNILRDERVRAHHHAWACTGSTQGRITIPIQNNLLLGSGLVTESEIIMSVDFKKGEYYFLKM